MAHDILKKRFLKQIFLEFLGILLNKVEKNPLSTEIYLLYGTLSFFCCFKSLSYTIFGSAQDPVSTTDTGAFR